MHEITFKESGAKVAEHYVFLGEISFDPQDDIASYFGFPKEKTIANWSNFFSTSSHAIQLTTWNYLLLYSRENELEFLETICGVQLASLILENSDEISEIVESWFMPYSAIFDRGLDFSLDDAEREIEKEVVDENGNYKELVFKDGSVLKFLTYDDDYRGLWILKSDVIDLENNLNKLSKLLV